MHATPYRRSPGRTTLTDLFPTNSKRMQFVRVMLRLMDPDLHKMDWNTPLKRDMVDKLETAIRADERA